MKKIYNLLLVLAIPAIFLVFTSGVMFHDGSPGGRTGSPGDNGANCTGCHAGTPINQDFWILNSDLLLTGYVPGHTYDIMVVGLDENANKFGFEATAEDNAGNKVGSFTAGMMGRTQTINNSEAITHTAMGNIPMADTGTVWLFTWTAPSTNLGDITMYTAVNAANGNGQNSGDQIHLSQFSFAYSTVGISENTKETIFNVYPVPSTGLVNIANIETTSDNRIAVVTLTGQVVYQDELSDVTTQLDLSYLEKGIYFVKIGKSTQRIILH
jgi:hypothetical protein